MHHGQREGGGREGAGVRDLGAPEANTVSRDGAEGAGGSSAGPSVSFGYLGVSAETQAQVWSSGESHGRMGVLRGPWPRPFQATEWPEFTKVPDTETGQTQGLRPLAGGEAPPGAQEAARGPPRGGGE